MKLVVEVRDASDLMPKDGQGSASPFVEVEFDQQRQRTQTKNKDLNPSWNEKLLFNVTDPSYLPNQIIDVVVYNDRRAGHHRNFLGRVRISGDSVPDFESDSSVQRYPLDKRGLFSHIRGDIALRIYALHDHPPTSNAHARRDAPPSQQYPSDGIGENINFSSHGGGDGKKKKNNNKQQKAKEATQTFHSIPSSNPPSGFDFFKPPPPPPPTEEKRADKAAYAVPISVHMAVPSSKNPEFELQETRPPLPGLPRRMGMTHDKTGSTYDLVEPMRHLFVAVVKARDLPTMDISGSLDPYVVVKLGNYMGITRHFEKNQNPVWNQTFSFSKDHLQASLLEVTVKDKDMVKDDFVGRVTFDLPEVPVRVPPDSPLAPQWYRLQDKKGDKISKGEIMLAVWFGTQADEAYPTATHSDTFNLSQVAISHTRSQVYYSPKLYYLRVLVIDAQDLVPSDKGRVLDPVVKIHVGNQVQITRKRQPFAPVGSANPVWNEELLFVVSEPSHEYLVITVEDRIGPQKLELLGRLRLSASNATMRLDHPKYYPSKWFNLEKPSSSASVEEGQKKEVKFSSKIHLQLVLDAGYHVLDESTHFSSDLQPSAKVLRKPSIGFLEMGILGARSLTMKNTYCVAKYGSKWIRTRTLLGTQTPMWNEQYTWHVFDPCTVVTVAVFDNVQVFGKKDEKDQRIGKVRIRLSTLEINRIYTYFYPLLVLHPSAGLKKMGDLHLALRFTCTAWVNMLALYSRPLLPKMHYVLTIPPHQTDMLRLHAIHIVAERLSRSEPPLRREAVEYMLDKDSHMWSFRKSKANVKRMTIVLSGFGRVGRWLDDVRNWKNPVTTVLVHVLFLILVWYPELILPTMFLYLFLIGIWNYRFRPRKPPHMDPELSLADRTHPDELDEEFDTFPTSRPADMVRMRYDRLRSLMGRMQTVLGDLATQGERAQALLSWRDPRATAIFVLFSLAFAVILYVTPFQVICVIAGLYLLRHPRFRAKKMPSVPFNFYKRLPAKSDQLI